ncbi:hypothetical protein SLE2022_237460 [Rubroshorea leprosula]
MPNSFDDFFKDLQQNKSLLHFDLVLFSGGSTDDIASEYNRSQQTFKSDFAAVMINMGDINPLTGSNGIISRVCTTMVLLLRLHFIIVVKSYCESNKMACITM